MREVCESIFIVLMFITMLLLTIGIVGAGILFWVDLVMKIA